MRSLRLAGALLVVLAPWSCRQPSSVSTSVVETLVRSPTRPVFAIAGSPGGAVFIAGPGYVMRALPPNYQDWVQVVTSEYELIALSAPANDVVFAISRACGRVFRWSEANGWEDLPTPVRDSVWVNGDHASCVSIFGLWARSTSEVYAVGSRGTILRFDGATWSQEANPISLSAPARSLGDGRYDLTSVSGDSDRVYVAGDRPMIRQDERWTLLPESPKRHSGCPPVAVAALRGAGLFAYNSCIQRHDGHEWSLVSETIPGVRGTLFEGQSQPDGSVLFWNYQGDVVSIGVGSPRVTRVDGFEQLAGATRLAGKLLVAGTRDGAGVVARVKE